LIEKAEERFREKETVRLVKREYEVLDGEGERESLRRGRERGGAKVGAKIVVGGDVVDDEDDYELI